MIDCEWKKLLAAGVSLNDALNRCNEKELPPSKENYSKLQNLWEWEGMETLMDLLKFYNNTDVEPFCEAVEKMQVFYKDMKICFLKDAISAPGIARKLIFREATNRGCHFPILDQSNVDLFHTIQSNLIGGASIIFHRYHEKDKTFINGNPEKPCKQILGLDANALYLYCLAQDMPVKNFVRRRAENGFCPEKK